MNHFFALFLSMILTYAQENLLTLAPPFDRASLEYSGLSWYGDTLVLLPQYPKGALLAVHRSTLLHALQAQRPLTLDVLPFDDSEVRKNIEGYEGYEAILFDGEDVYALIEARDAQGMAGYLCKGVVREGGIMLHASQKLPMPQHIDNYAFEAMTLTPEGVLVMFESNIQSEVAKAYMLSKTLQSIKAMAIAPIAYRITDATAMRDGTFWVSNAYWSGDAGKLRSERQTNMGQLLQLSLKEEGIYPTGRSILLNEGGVSYNWEGVVHFHEGFLVITDTYPRTQFVYVQIAPDHAMVR
ncbi:MAG: hypothetical protein KU37_09275 [Sulfuricurvum sp. PC08-66]|nr:MAG: hypothetical protein KU37_09275 [Sulfuricurvum sp. PC08-66]